MIAWLSRLFSKKSAAKAPRPREIRPDQPEPKVSVTRSTVSQANRAFAVDLLRALSRQNPSDNLLFSPVSISIALGMTHSGARGETAEEMAKVLHFAGVEQNLSPQFERLVAALGDRARQPASAPGRPSVLRVANSLWAQTGFAFAADFVDGVRQHYGAEARQVDFSATTTAVQQINDWVSEQTANRIQDLLSPEVVRTITTFALVNAVYFDMPWSSPFSPENTQSGPFQLADGSTATVPFMTKTELLGYAEQDGAYQAVQLPYLGHALSMVVVLPRRRDLGRFVDELDYDRLFRVLESPSLRTVSLRLPRFRLEQSFALGKVLASLGMRRAFTAEADFGKMAEAVANGTVPLWIGEVVHQAFLAADEAGTEAAAATAVVGFLGVRSAPEPVAMTVDRPFLFVLRDIPTNTILFMGRVLDPRR
jgi:serpin B